MSTQEYQDGQKSLLIANPMYNTVFKRLMENKRAVKIFLSALLEKEVVEIESNPQRITYREGAKSKGCEMAEKAEKEGVSLCHTTFLVTTLTDTGEQKRILVEVQQSWNALDLMRFRSYQTEQYRRIKKINGIDIVLPITTIYVLGFDLPKIDSPCISIDLRCTDEATNDVLNVDSPFLDSIMYHTNMIPVDKIIDEEKAKILFMNNLTHKNFVIQANKITKRYYNTQLDKLLSVFEQANFTEEDSKISKQYFHQPDDGDIKVITSILHKMICDPEKRKQIEEEEAIRLLNRK